MATSKNAKPEVRTFEKDGDRRTTTAADEAVRLRFDGYQEVKATKAEVAAATAPAPKPSN